MQRRVGASWGMTLRGNAERAQRGYPEAGPLELNYSGPYSTEEGSPEVTRQPGSKRPSPRGEKVPEGRMRGIPLCTGDGPLTWPSAFLSRGNAPGRMRACMQLPTSRPFSPRGEGARRADEGVHFAPGQPLTWPSAFLSQGRRGLKNGLLPARGEGARRADEGRSTLHRRQPLTWPSAILSGGGED